MLFAPIFISLANLWKKTSQKAPEPGLQLHFLCLDVDVRVTVAWLDLRCCEGRRARLGCVWRLRVGIQLLPPATVFLPDLGLVSYALIAAALKPRTGFDGWERGGKEVLRCWEPSPSLSNSMGVFVRVSFRWQRWSLTEGAQTTLLPLEGEGGRPGDVGRGIKNRQMVPHRHCPKNLQPISVPVTGSGSPVTAEIKPSFSFSPIPCPCRRRVLHFPVKQSWF